MKNLLLKLGLIKISLNEFLKNLEGLSNKFSDLFFHEVNLEIDDKNKAKAEFKIFLFIYIYPVLKTSLKEDYSNLTIQYFEGKIFFQDVEYLNLTPDFKYKLAKSRSEIHNEGLEDLANGNHNYYFKQLSLMFFRKPFYQFGKQGEAFPLNFDPIAELKSNFQITNLFNEMLPHYVDFIKKYSKKIK